MYDLQRFINVNMENSRFKENSFLKKINCNSITNRWYAVELGFFESERFYKTETSKQRSHRVFGYTVIVTKDGDCSIEHFRIKNRDLNEAIAETVSTTARIIRELEKYKVQGGAK